MRLCHRFPRVYSAVCASRLRFRNVVVAVAVVMVVVGVVVVVVVVGCGCWSLVVGCCLV